VTSEAPPTEAVQAVPDDADDLRGFHVRRLMGKTATLALIGAGALAAAAVGSALAGPLVGLAALLGAIVAGVLVVLAIADSRAADAFFASYARRRGLELNGRSRLPEATPLLRKGDDRYAERSLSGAFDRDCEGILALYTYEEETTDSRGNRQTSYHRYTVGLVEVAECAARVPELACRRRAGFKALDGLEDYFRTHRRRVELESTALDDRYEIFSAKDQDQNWLRQLFSPGFIVWLTESAPDTFAFELEGGVLCCYLDRHRESAADLDALRAASAAVARRLREESLE
jgi:hypothetical protein